jgi:hypothetical protein
MGGQSRVAHLADVGVIAEALGQHARVALRAFQAQRQRAQAAQAQVALQRPWRRTAELPRLQQRGEVRVVGDDGGAEQQVGVAAHRLGGAVHDDVGTEL